MRTWMLLSALFIAVPAFGQDSDNDGTADAYDARPCDAAVQGEAFAPAEGQFALTLFEDQWPRAGDTDFNDAVVAHHYRFALDGAGRVVGLHARFVVLALGAMNDNGLGLHLPLPRSAVSTIELAIDGGSPGRLTPSSADAELTVVIHPNLRAQLGGQVGQINTLPDRPVQPAVTFDLVVALAVPQSMSRSEAPFDLFLFRTDDPTHEIHRVAYAGTAAMDPTRFGTDDDASGNGRWFVDRDGLPFALDLPQIVAHPGERRALSSLYPDVLSWARSGGQQHPDWYRRTVVTSNGYRDVNGATVPEPPSPVTPAPDTSCLPAGPVRNGLFFWLDGDDVDGDFVAEGITEAALDGSGRVTEWRDKSGNGFHVSPRPGQSRATLVIDALPGLDAPRFDRNSIYEHRTGATLASYTVFLVADRVTWGGGNRREILSAGEDRGVYPLDWAVQGGRVEHYRGSAASLVLRGERTSSWSGFRKIAFTQDRLSTNQVLARFWVNGSEQSRASGNWENLYDELWVGGKVENGSDRNRWNGEIAEILVYDRSLSPTEIASVERYLATKWRLSSP